MHVPLAGSLRRLLLPWHGTLQRRADQGQPRLKPSSKEHSGNHLTSPHTTLSTHPHRAFARGRADAIKAAGRAHAVDAEAAAGARRLQSNGGAKVGRGLTLHTVKVEQEALAQNVTSVEALILPCRCHCRTTACLRGRRSRRRRCRSPCRVSVRGWGWGWRVHGQH